MPLIEIRIGDSGTPGGPSIVRVVLGIIYGLVGLFLVWYGFITAPAGTDGTISGIFGALNMVLGFGVVTGRYWAYRWGMAGGALTAVSGLYALGWKGNSDGWGTLLLGGAELAGLWYARASFATED